MENGRQEGSRYRPVAARTGAIVVGRSCRSNWTLLAYTGFIHLGGLFFEEEVTLLARPSNCAKMKRCNRLLIPVSIPKENDCVIEQ